MRILFLGNNWVGWQVVRSLREHGAEIVGAVLHPPEHRSFGDDLRAALGLPDARLFDGSRLGERSTLDAIAALRPQLGVCAFFRYLLQPALRELLPLGCVNLHPSLLPYNRGAYPNVWSIVDRTPAGVSLHLIDAGVDAGPVLAQRPVPVEPIDTGATLYRKLERACVELLDDTWPLLADGPPNAAPQSDAHATAHCDRDVDRIDRIDLDATCRAGDLIDLLRARTFAPHRGAYFVANGRRVYLRLELEYGEADAATTAEDVSARPAAR